MAELEQLSDLLAALTVAIEENTRMRQAGDIEFVGKKAIAAVLDCHPNNVRNYHEGGKQNSGWIMGIHYVRPGGKGPHLYNRPLISDWLRNSHDPAAHMRAIEVYQKSKMGYRKQRRKSA